MSRVILAVALFAAIVAVSATDSSAHHLFLRAHHSKGTAQFAASSGPVRIPVEKGHGWHEAPTPSRHSHIVGDKAQYFVHYSAFDKNEPLSDPAAILQTIADVISCDKSRVQYVPEHTFVAMMTAEQAEQVQQLPFVLWVGKVKPEHKFDDHVFSDPHAKVKAELRATSVARPFTLRTAPGASVALPHIPLLGIHRIEVLLHPGAVSSREEAVVLAQSWAAHFKPAASAGVAIQSVESDELALAAYAVSPNIMHWAVSEAHLSDVVEFMSHQEQVQFVYAVEPAHTFNYDSASIIQTNKLPTDSGSTRIWSKGLTGQGQVIGVGDSGLDYRNCLFYDPSVDLDSKICSQCNLFSYYTQDLQNLYTNPACIQTDAKCINATGHRKVKGYYAFVDNLDPLWGHGSHVCGTVAGKARSGSPALLTQYNGNAPDAQLVISDLNSDTILNEADIATPPDLSADYFQYSYKLGARVHTNSWGSRSNVVYGSASQLIDRFTYQYKDMLVLFAAGNGGTGGFQTVASQAQAKNILTVGSSNTDVSHRAAVFDAQVSEAWQRINRTVCTASVWNAPYKSGVDMTVCGAVKFYYSTTDSCDTLSAYFCNAIQDPTYCVTLEAGKNSAGTREYGLANALPHVQGIGTEFASCSLNAIAVVDPIGNQETNITGIAYYSSRGPTSDGRIKPDLVAPGNYIISSRAAYPKLASGEFCSDDNSNPLYALAAKSGTSMATPGLAGAAALVRQYYADGYGACGQADSAHSPTYISSALLKATLIHSGVLIAGPYINSTDPQLSHFLGTDPRDRFVRGFGLAKLSSVLRFTDDQYELLYYDVNAVSFSDRRVATGVSKDFPFTLSSSSGPLKVTLVWSDPPPAGVSGVTLVNNLDLIVTDPSNNVYYGNHFFVSNSRDTLNNVEQVRLDNVVAGTWTITVNGFNVPIDSPSDYALIVTYKTASPASQYPLCSSTPSPLPGPVFTTAPTVSDADVKSGRHVIVGSLSVPGKVYYAAIKRGSASPPLSPYQLSHFLFGNGNDMDSSVVKGFVSTAGSNSFTVEVVLPAGRWTVYLVAADASDVTQAQMTALDAFASSGPRTAAGWLLTVSLIVLGTMFAVLF